MPAHPSELPKGWVTLDFVSWVTKLKYHALGSSPIRTPLMASLHLKRKIWRRNNNKIAPKQRILSWYALVEQHSPTFIQFGFSKLNLSHLAICSFVPWMTTFLRLGSSLSPARCGPAHPQLEPVETPSSCLGILSAQSKLPLDSPKWFHTCICRMAA